MVEKGGTDEAFLNITEEIEFKMKYDKNIAYKNWDGAYFMPYKKDGDKFIGSFLPETELDKKLFLANQMAKNIRDTVKKELGYNLSAGISHNKTLAKMASQQDKPNN